jgi:predicted signal transduction protein with EAL and GGDEF domain
MPRLRWHRRLEARVAVVLGVIVAGALGVALTVTTRAVATQSRERAETELEAARAAFYDQLHSRTASALAASQLVTELPVFRAHLTETRLASDLRTIETMADGYRRQMAADFAIVTNAQGEWLASPGWQDDSAVRPVAGDLRRMVDLARSGFSSTGIVTRPSELFLAVATPARFSDEVLGTLIIGYQVTDALAGELARLAHCEVVVLTSNQIAASSLSTESRQDVAAVATAASSAGIGVRDGLVRLGRRTFVAAAYPLQAGVVPEDLGRLVVLADWQPTQQFVDGLRNRLLLGGLAAFTLALVLGLFFSRSVSRPLRDIAAAAARIADGDLTLRLPLRGSAEAMTVAHAFNDMGMRLSAARERLEHDAIHDSLTMLPNRVLLMERLDRAMARRAQHPDYRFAVLFLDVDRFKHVNDSLGHAVGDRFLKAFAERLATAVRRNDIVTRASDHEDPEPNTLARFGGDEFVVLLDDIRDPIDAVRVAQRVQHESSIGFRVGDQVVIATASIGVAVSSPAHRSADDVVRDADLAMYRAKSEGGATYVVFDDTMHDAAVERFRLENELRRAVAHREFSLWYQPIVSLTDRSVQGYEALIRWRHPERGLLSPISFLDVAEQIGLMAIIDEWALEEACRQGRAWQLAKPDEPPPTISVNLSSKAFASASLVALVAEILAKTEFPAEALRLEVTEGVAMANPAKATEILGELRSLGVRVSLDDFGTGYCSLSYLQQFPVDMLKIDKSFVARIDENGSDAEIVRLIVALARTLGLEVVAEGTETQAQVDYLVNLGCGFGQGYLFARAAPPSGAPGQSEVADDFATGTDEDRSAA